jgi:hypothetical protein
MNKPLRIISITTKNFVMNIDLERLIFCELSNEEKFICVLDGMKNTIMLDFPDNKEEAKQVYDFIIEKWLNYRGQNEI